MEAATVPQVLTRDARAHAGREVVLRGWVHHVRDLGGLIFFMVRDRGGIAQVVMETKDQKLPIARESIVRVRGTVKEEPRAVGGYELQAAAVEVIAQVSEHPPIDLAHPLERSKLTLDTLLEHRALSVRHPEARAIFKVQAEIVWAFCEHLRSQDFTEIHSSKLVSTGTEGGSEVFTVNYFDRKAFLAQSPQFYKQIMVGSGFERVYEVGPVYRAEKHATARHLNEYVSLDVEMGFIESERDLIDLEIGLLRHVFSHVTQTCREELALLGQQLPEIGTVPVLRLSEAKDALAGLGKTLGADDDLDPEAERVLCEEMRRAHGIPMVFVTHYPRTVRPVYAMPDPGDPALTRSFDLLYEGLEITTGGQRIHEAAMLERSMRDRGLDPSGFAYYLEAFRFGMPPHGGFAIGLERLTAKLLGLKNIREASLFPRDRLRISP
ncbi:MAG: aspartate--tRNA(Asn) ligase [Acidobacteriota bacterium]